MKEKLKNQNGITLIALIITIIVLLILAMVSIKLIWDGGIIAHSKNAVNAYNEVQVNELEQLNTLVGQMSEYSKNENNDLNWWEITEVEKDQIRYNSSDKSYDVAIQPIGDISLVSIASLVGDKDCLGIKSDKKLGAGNAIYFILTDEAKEFLQQAFNTQLEKYKWYLVENTVIEEYKGGCPIAMEDFTKDEIFCESYLERIIASFNN